MEKSKCVVQVESRVPCSLKTERSSQNSVQNVRILRAVFVRLLEISEKNTGRPAPDSNFLLRITPNSCIFIHPSNRKCFEGGDADIEIRGAIFKLSLRRACLNSPGTRLELMKLGSRIGSFLSRVLLSS